MHRSDIEEHNRLVHELALKDAEIARLREAERLSWHCFKEKEAEIARLKEEQVKLFAIYDKLEQEAIGKDAEIARLKEILRRILKHTEVGQIVTQKDAEIAGLKEELNLAYKTIAEPRRQKEGG